MYLFISLTVLLLLIVSTAKLLRSDSLQECILQKSPNAGYWYKLNCFSGIKILHVAQISILNTITS